MSAEPSGKSRAWPMFDAIVAAGAGRHTNPWALDETGEPRFHPDYGTLEKLLAVPLQLAATSQSGVPALAIDVWVAYELRRAALDPTRSGRANRHPASSTATCCASSSRCPNSTAPS